MPSLKGGTHPVMLRGVLSARALVALMIAGAVGVWGLRAHPIATDDPFLALIAAEKPLAFHVLAYGYGHATLWFTTPFFAASLLLSMVAIAVSTWPQRVRARSLPPYPEPEHRPTPFLVLGETHLARISGPAPDPTWLAIPQRGLYTGVMVLGAVGTGKTSACMYPYVDQLLRWRQKSETRNAGISRRRDEQEHEKGKKRAKRRFRERVAIKNSRFCSRIWLAALDDFRNWLVR
jgi:hypothetical protein